MIFLLSIIFSCHQKDPDPIVVPTKEEPQETLYKEVLPPPKPTTANLPMDPWSLHPSLIALKNELYQKQYEIILKKKDLIAAKEHKAILSIIAHRKKNTLVEAIPHMSTLEKTKIIPEDFRDLLCAELYLEQGKNNEAHKRLQNIPQKSPFYIQAQTLLVESVPKEEQFSVLIKRLADTPVTKLPLLLSKLLALAPSQDQKFFICKQIFILLPKTQLAIKTNPMLKKMLKKKGYVITQRDRAIRAESLMRDNLFVALTREYKKHISYGSANEVMCRIWYAYGRSLFKTNNVTASQKPLLKVAQDCKGIRDDLGAKAYYIAAKGLDRKKDYAGSAKLFASIPEHYPTHSMADDGYLLAGIGWQNGDALEKALPMWSKQVEVFPDGDMMFEGYWRLAWGLYLNEKTTKAISWADRSRQEPLQGDITHAMALRYWGARWKIYPNSSNPNQETTNLQAKEKGISELIQICTGEPTHFYALLSAQLLQELAPERFSKLSPPKWLTNTPKSTWIVPISYIETEAFSRTKQFAELGLLDLALQEAQYLPLSSATDHALFSILEKKRDPIIGHDRLHKKLNRFAPSQFKSNHLNILTIGYPQSYWDTVQDVSSAHRYDPRIFHSLVREESSFNPKIVSWAGAKGLSQLMPATAKQVAGWMDISLKKDAIFDAKTNLSIGSRYLNHLHKYFDDNSFMAVGSYNAGAGNMNKWYAKFGPTPVDHLIEQIPIRETRGYIKRVLGTYQLYSTISKKELSFPNWSRFNKSAQPK